MIDRVNDAFELIAGGHFEEPMGNSCRKGNTRYAGTYRQQFKYSGSVL